ncbi:hypothetical protein LTR85_009244 [Meristemomyces frigidus]|nr:hypothetical protein LTR85_009244 [Meristemomyces frigidus]
MDTYVTANELFPVPCFTPTQLLEDTYNSTDPGPRIACISIHVGTSIMTASGKPGSSMEGNIVCTQSDFFMKACTGRFNEAAERKVDLSGDDPQAVNGMLEYFCKHTYSTEDAVAAGTAVAILHVRVYNLADKYDVQGLKDHTLAEFQPIAEQRWKEKGFAESIHEIISEGPETSPLRACVMDMLLDHAVEVLIGDGDLQPVRTAIATLPELVLDIASSLARAHQQTTARIASISQYQCPNCQYVHAAGAGDVATRHLGGARCPVCGGYYKKAEWEKAKTRKEVNCRS